jgi:pimeloyl-ACP methyl ester carboxylesterase
MRKILIAALASMLTLTAVAVAPATTTAQQLDWFVDEEKLPFDPLPGAEAYWGVRSGAGYLMEVPENWNGDLVLYAHGYRGEGLELTVDPPPIRPWLIEQGFAWAASSYRANGYVPGTGARDTHALIGEFRGRVANPDRVFITGFSMGGHVTAAAIEQWPKSFDGAVPMCGVMGDNELFDYFQDVYLLAEHFAGNEPAVPTPEGYTDPFPTGGWVSTAAALGLFGGPTPPGGQDFKDAIEQLTGGERPIFDEGYVGTYGALFPFFFGVATTDDGRENLETVYQLDSDPALSDEELALNEAIPRIAPEPQFRHPNGLGRTPGSTNDSPHVAGDFDIPVLSMHTLGELFVPFHMQQIYAERAAANGNDDMLVVRAIRDVNHCGFTVQEQVEAFADMITWVDAGVRPAGDAILDPAAVADPSFGCEFTLVNRPGLPACP